MTVLQKYSMPLFVKCIGGRRPNPKLFGIWNLKWWNYSERKLHLHLLKRKNEPLFFCYPTSKVLLIIMKPRDLFSLQRCKNELPQPIFTQKKTAYSKVATLLDCLLWTSLPKKCLWPHLQIHLGEEWRYCIGVVPTPFSRGCSHCVYHSSCYAPIFFLRSRSLSASSLPFQLLHIIEEENHFWPKNEWRLWRCCRL